MAENPALPLAGAQDEVAELLSDLIRIDTTNTGDTATSAGERAAAEWVACTLADAGIESEIHESEPGRASLVARIEGTDPSRPPLLVHGHLDVVPADPAEWSVHPFSGEERGGYIWGRGAVDMKDMDAMVLALVRDWARTGVRPPRDIVLAFVADEEAGGRLGARWLVDEHPDLFEGCTEAISEVGGFSITVRDDLRLYLVQTAEKGLAWMRLTAGGRPGSRLVRARRQHRHPAVRGRRPARLHPAAHRAHSADAPVPRRRRGTSASRSTPTSPRRRSPGSGRSAG